MDRSARTPVPSVVKRPHDEGADRQEKKQKTDQDYSKGGLVHSLHGNIYQLKLLMLFLYRGLDKKYAFRLATEWDAAEKFDDLVFEYTEDNKKKYRFLQAKHKQDESKKISVNDLLTETDGEFSLQKYFISYRKIKQNTEFNGQNNELKDFIICTNIDLGDDLQLSFESVLYKDNILDKGVQSNSNSRKPKLLKLKIDKFPKNKRIFSILKNSSDLSRLAKELARHVIEAKQINLKNPLFKSYHYALKEEKVINTKNQEFHDDFIDGHNLSLSAKNFRDFFQEEASKIKNLPEKDIWNEIKGKTIKFI